jgi:FkbM family methyltransferase
MKERNILIDGKSYFLTSDDNYLDAMGADFEPHMVELLKSLIGPNEIILDIGANIGLTSILFSSLALKVYAFEPSPSTFRILQENLSRAKADKVHAVNIGCGAREEQMNITFSTNNRSGGFVSDKIQLKKDHITEQIQINSLDYFFSGHDERIAFIKIDVEGFEAEVIKGARALLEKFKPLVVLELNHYCLNILRRITVPDFFDFLRSVFPYLYAVDVDNTAICDLHDETQAFYVMLEHTNKFRFQNLVAGFDAIIFNKLKELEKTAKKRLSSAAVLKFDTPIINDARGRLEVENTPHVVEPGAVFFIDVTVFNESCSKWVTIGDKPVRLSYHWKDMNGNSIIHDGERSLTGVDEIMEKISVKMKVVAPFLEGAYELVVTIVQEGVCWFENQGFKPYVFDMKVARREVGLTP